MNDMKTYSGRRIKGIKPYERTIKLKSYDSEDNGRKIDMIWLDEEVDEDVFRECMKRVVRNGGKAIVYSAPPTNRLLWTDKKDDKKF